MSGKETSSVKLTLVSENGAETMRITSQYDLMKEFMTVMSVAHEVVAEDPNALLANNIEEDQNEDPSKLVYQGPSPDEVTLVEFARERGFCFITSNDSMAKIAVINDSPGQGRPSIVNTSFTTYHADRSEINIKHREEDMMEFDHGKSNIRHRQDSGNATYLRF